MKRDRRIIASICYVVLGAVLYWVSFLILSRKY